MGPGTYHYNYGSEKYILKSVKVEMLEIPKQHMMTRDSVTVEVDAVVYYQVFDVKKAIVNVNNESLATLNIAQATLRTVIGENTLNKLFSKRQEMYSHHTNRHTLSDHDVFCLLMIYFSLISYEQQSTLDGAD